MGKIQSNLLFLILIALVLTFISMTGPVHAQKRSFPDGLIGLSSTDPAVLYSIDESSGKATPIVTLDGLASLTGLAYLRGILYGTDLFFPGGTGNLNIGSISTDGIITFLGDQNGSPNWHGLASDEAKGVMYTIDLQNNNILTLQFPDGSVETVGSGTGIDGRGLEFDSTHGILYGLDFNGSLYTISTSTGTSNLIGPSGFTRLVYAGLAYDECKQILYFNNGDNMQLYTLDVTTGAATLVGSNGVDVPIDGLAWKGPCGAQFASPIPTLSEWGMITSALGLGLIGMFFAVRRRMKAHAV